MPRPGTMRRTNSRAFLAAALMYLIAAAGAQDSAQPASPSQPSQPQSQVPGSQQPPEREGGVFIFRKDVDEVLLHATVTDGKKQMITSLDRAAFSVFEDGKAQRIT